MKMIKIELKSNERRKEESGKQTRNTPKNRNGEERREIYYYNRNEIPGN